jgi:hypothetical protein
MSSISDQQCRRLSHKQILEELIAKDPDDASGKKGGREASLAGITKQEAKVQFEKDKETTGYRSFRDYWNDLCEEADEETCGSE